MVRVRFAPSPTGAPHIGWARTSLQNWLFARHEGGVFVLRIEDTDQKRTQEDAQQAFDDAYRWMGIFYDEGPSMGGPFGPYIQTERKPFHEAALKKLLDEGKAYPCFCTTEELEKNREAQRLAGQAPRYMGTCRHLPEAEATRRLQAGERHVIRLKIPTSGEVVVKDLVRGEVTFDMTSVDDFVIRKADGTATYNFAVVVDDAGMEITHVIRADEHLSNTPKQLLVFEALGLTPPAFAHVPMILAADRSKLSKRHGSMALHEFQELGYLPEAFVNYITLLGWHPGGDQEFLTLDETVQMFTLDKIQKNAAVYDLQKLTWMNGQYLRKLPGDDLFERALPFLERVGLVTLPLEGDLRDYTKRAVLAVRERVSTLVEVADACTYFFKEPETYDEKGAAKHFRKEGTGKLLTALAEKLENAPFDSASLEALYTELAESLGVARGDLIHPTRLAVTGRTMGPGLFELLEILGADKTVPRLRRAVAHAAP